MLKFKSKTRSVPEAEVTPEPLPLTRHWLFETLPGLARANGPERALKLSLNRNTAFAARS